MVTSSFFIVPNGGKADDTQTTHFDHIPKTRDDSNNCDDDDTTYAKAVADATAAMTTTTTTTI